MQLSCINDQFGRCWPSQYYRRCILLQKKATFHLTQKHHVPIVMERADTTGVTLCNPSHVTCLKPNDFISITWSRGGYKEFLLLLGENLN